MWPLGLTYLSWHNVFRIHPNCRRYQTLIPIYGWMIFHCTGIPFFAQSSFSWLTSGLFPLWAIMNNATISTYVPKKHYPLLFERTRMKNSPGGHSKILGGKQQIQGEGSLQLQPAADSQRGLVETNHLQFLQVWGRTWELAFLTSFRVTLVPVQGTPSENHSSVTLWLKLCSADPWHHLRAG